MKYEDYILSKGWEIMRAFRLSLDKHTCQKCGRKHELRVHHLNYDRLEKEKLEDLITLCVRCHNDIHGEFEQIDELQQLKHLPVTQDEYEEQKNEH